jgi:anhydro-N-acetylmuramic acid kinase
MSGTSVDGIDAVLVDFTDPLSVLGHVRHAIPQLLRQAIFDLCHPGHDEISRTAAVDNQLARVYAESVRALLKSTEIDAKAVAAIGCHGQTVRHEPDSTDPYSLQLGNPCVLAELTQIPVITDFRRRDIAAGGQGAPLAPAFHQAFFASDECPVAVLNLGGMANISLLLPGEQPWGFDTGPGNVLMDIIATQRLGRPFDDHGLVAASGTVLPELLAELFDDEFFRRSPPKSTGRERFSEAWLRERAGTVAHLAPADLLATLAELTARTVADALIYTGVTASELIVCGGGALNRHLLARLHSATGLTVVTSEFRGMNPQVVEAAGFAWLARQRLAELPGNVPRTTGAAGPRILGGSYCA